MGHITKKRDRMDERLKESISALMDGEADELELRRILLQLDGESLHATWSSYHRIQTSLRSGEGRQSLGIDVSASVSAFLLKDDRLTSSENLDALKRVEKSAAQSCKAAKYLNLTDVPSDGAAHADQKRRPNWLPALAVAASLLLAVVLIKPTIYGPDSSMLNELLVSQDEPQHSVQNVQYAKNAPVIVELSGEDVRLFNEYLFRHAEYASIGAMQGTMPLVRVASFNAMGI